VAVLISSTDCSSWAELPTAGIRRSSRTMIAPCKLSPNTPPHSPALSQNARTASCAVVYPVCQYRTLGISYPPCSRRPSTISAFEIIGFSAILALLISKTELPRGAAQCLAAQSSGAPVGGKTCDDPCPSALLLDRTAAMAYASPFGPRGSAANCPNRPASHRRAR